MPAPAVIVNVFGKFDGFLTGWGPTRNPEGPKEETMLSPAWISLRIRIRPHAKTLRRKGGKDEEGVSHAPSRWIWQIHGTEM